MMKEKLYTIPLNDAINENDECPFCFIERRLEQDAIEYTLGACASYMESDTREKTDQIGFCREHMQKMFSYGNALGNALILDTHYKKLLKEMEEKFSSYKPGKTSLKDRLRHDAAEQNPIHAWTREKDESCFICQNIEETFARYIETFFYLYRQDDSFRKKIIEGKGFCLHHFGILMEGADRWLNDKERADFYPQMFELMKRNLTRVSEDVSWFVKKYDYRYKDEDWKNSKDAIQRGMQKLRGGYPADPPYRAK